jgi:hypothetical protein
LSRSVNLFGARCVTDEWRQLRPYDNKTEIVAVAPAVGFHLHWIVDGELIEREPVVAFIVFKRPTVDGEYFISLSIR